MSALAPIPAASTKDAVRWLAERGRLGWTVSAVHYGGRWRVEIKLGSVGKPTYLGESKSLTRAVRRVQAQHTPEAFGGR